MLALDKDKRHFMTDMHHVRYTLRATRKGELRDRREVPKTTEGWIPLTEKQIVPAGPKQLDTVQQLVDLVISQVKRQARQQLPVVGIRTGSMLCDAVFNTVQSVTTENVASYWMHAKQAIRVWSALDSEIVDCMLSRNGYSVPYQFMGTHAESCIGS
jgi:hypothetical protein